MNIQGSEIIRESAALRAKGQFDEAIKLIEKNIDAIDPDIRLNAWLEAFKAAKGKGDVVQAKKYAKAVAAEEPDVPSIQEYL